MQLLFVAGKCGLKYAELLEEQGKWAEAIKQCRLVHDDLVENFGEDYLEWLPEAPNAAQMLERLRADLHP